MRSGGGAFLDSYNAVDIALDTFPYNGTTTTCEALLDGRSGRHHPWRPFCGARRGLALD